MYRPNILIDTGIRMKLARLIKMCLTETYSSVRVGKNLSDMFPIRNGLKKGDFLSPLFDSLTLEPSITEVQTDNEGLKFGGTHQVLVYADDVNLQGYS